MLNLVYDSVVWVIQYFFLENGDCRVQQFWFKVVIVYFGGKLNLVVGIGLGLIIVWCWFVSQDDDKVKVFLVGFDIVLVECDCDVLLLYQVVYGQWLLVWNDNLDDDIVVFVCKQLSVEISISDYDILLFDVFVYQLCL